MTHDEEHFLNIHPDESRHVGDMSEEIVSNLDLAETAAIITLNGFCSIKDPVRFNEPKGLILLLLSKAAKNIRLAAVGLRLGYYSGSSAVIRSALESLSYAALFDKYPARVDEWFINEFSSRTPAQKADVLRKQASDAKKALLELETNRLTIKDAMNEFLEKANQTLHTSMSGLAEEFGMDVGELVPDDFGTEFENAGGNFVQAMSRYAFLRRFGKSIAKKQGPVDETQPSLIQIYGRYHEPTLSDLALFSFFVAHRILDIAKMCFDFQDEAFNEDYRAWHKEIHQTH